MYQVMKKGHKIGHHTLDYGTFVTAKDLGVTEEALRPYLARGVLAAVTPAPEETPTADDGPTVEPVSDRKSKKQGKKDS